MAWPSPLVIPATAFLPLLRPRGLEEKTSRHCPSLQRPRPVIRPSPGLDKSTSRLPNVICACSASMSYQHQRTFMQQPSPLVVRVLWIRSPPYEASEAGVQDASIWDNTRYLQGLFSVRTRPHGQIRLLGNWLPLMLCLLCTRKGLLLGFSVGRSHEGGGGGWDVGL